MNDDCTPGKLVESMKTGRILHRDYFIHVERNIYSWRIAAITDRLGKSLLRRQLTFIQTGDRRAMARAAIDSNLNGGRMD